MPLTIGPVAQVIKSRTFHSHARAEKLLMPRLEAIRSYADYATVLKMFYGFFFPLQQRIANYVTARYLEDIEERRQATLIIQDLNSIGSSAENIPLCAHLPEIENIIQAFGALYVLEGATLGGRIIAKMLRQNNHLKLAEENISFFNGYKEATGVKWKTFLEALNQQADPELLVTTADKTFLLFHKWINTCYVHEYTSRKRC